MVCAAAGAVTLAVRCRGACQRCGGAALGLSDGGLQLGPGLGGRARRGRARRGGHRTAAGARLEQIQGGEIRANEVMDGRGGRSSRPMWLHVSGAD
jgi:hypothetical protein